MYKHILVALDNSPADDVIVGHIRPLAKLTGATLLLVHVADGFVARNQEQLGLDESAEMREDRAYLEGRRAELQADGFEVQSILACGEPTEQLVAIAHREQCDLIAMATHGHRWISDLILGSVASEVRHRTDIPVLLLRARNKRLG